MGSAFLGAPWYGNLISLKEAKGENALAIAVGAVFDQTTFLFNENFHLGPKQKSDLRWPGTPYPPHARPLKMELFVSFIIGNPWPALRPNKPCYEANRGLVGFSFAGISAVVAVLEPKSFLTLEMALVTQRNTMF